MIEEIRPEQSKEWSSFLGRHSLMADLRIPIFLAVDMTQLFILVIHTTWSSFLPPEIVIM